MIIIHIKPFRFLGEFLLMRERKKWRLGCFQFFQSYSKASLKKQTNQKKQQMESCKMECPIKALWDFFAGRTQTGFHVFGKGCVNVCAFPIFLQEEMAFSAHVVTMSQGGDNILPLSYRINLCYASIQLERYTN